MLRSDDARDTFKKSFDSQSFIQIEKKKHDHRRKLGLVPWASCADEKELTSVLRDTEFTAYSTRSLF